MTRPRRPLEPDDGLGLILLHAVAIEQHLRIARLRLGRAGFGRLSNEGGDLFARAGEAVGDFVGWQSVDGIDRGRGRSPADTGDQIFRLDWAPAFAGERRTPRHRPQ